MSALDDFANADAAIDAMFGTEAARLRPGGGVQWVRNRDGLWMKAGGPAYTRVSAVLSTERLSPWDVGQRRMRLIHNPWAARPILDLPLGVDVMQIEDDQLRTTPGEDLRQVFGLPDSWPED